MNRQIPRIGAAIAHFLRFPREKLLLPAGKDGKINKVCYASLFSIVCAS